MKILCFGDSNTYGYDPRGAFGGRYPPEHRWVDILGALSGWNVVGAGENGREIPRRPGETERFLTLLAREQPDVLTVVLGGNDLLQGASPAEAAGRMETLLKKIPGPQRILLVGPPPKALGTWVPSERMVADSRELARQYKALAEKLGTGYADAGPWQVELTFDGVHYTERGHEAFAAGMFDALRELLNAP